MGRGMSREKRSFKQSDITRAIKAAQAAGIRNYRVEVADNGKPVIIVGSGMDKPKSETVGSWDSVIAELESR
jgi:hypothetical protein